MTAATADEPAGLLAMLVGLALLGGLVVAATRFRRPTAQRLRARMRRP